MKSKKKLIVFVVKQIKKRLQRKKSAHTSNIISRDNTGIEKPVANSYTAVKPDVTDKDVELIPDKNRSAADTHATEMHDRAINIYLNVQINTAANDTSSKYAHDIVIINTDPEPQKQFVQNVKEEQIQLNDLNKIFKASKVVCDKTNQCSIESVDRGYESNRSPSMASVDKLADEDDDDAYKNTHSVRGKKTTFLDKRCHNKGRKEKENNRTSNGENLNKVPDTSYQSKERLSCQSNDGQKQSHHTHEKLNRVEDVVDIGSELRLSTFENDITDVRTGLKSFNHPSMSCELISQCLEEQEINCSLQEQKEPIADLPDLQPDLSDDETCYKCVIQDSDENKPELPLSEFDISSGYPVCTYSTCRKELTMSSYSVDTEHVGNSEVVSARLSDQLDKNRINADLLDPRLNISHNQSTDASHSFTRGMNPYEFEAIFMIALVFYKMAKELLKRGLQPLENINRIFMQSQRSRNNRLFLSIESSKHGCTIYVRDWIKLRSTCRLQSNEDNCRSKALVAMTINRYQNVEIVRTLNVCFGSRCIQPMPPPMNQSKAIQDCIGYGHTETKECELLKNDILVVVVEASKYDKEKTEKNTNFLEVLKPATNDTCITNTCCNVPAGTDLDEEICEDLDKEELICNRSHADLRESVILTLGTTHPEDKRENASIAKRVISYQDRKGNTAFNWKELNDVECSENDVTGKIMSLESQDNNNDDSSNDLIVGGTEPCEAESHGGLNHLKETINETLNAGIFCKKETNSIDDGKVCCHQANYGLATANSDSAGIETVTCDNLRPHIENTNIYSSSEKNNWKGADGEMAEHIEQYDSFCTSELKHSECFLEHTQLNATSNKSKGASQDNTRRTSQKKSRNYFCKYCHKKREVPNENCKFLEMHNPVTKYSKRAMTELGNNSTTLFDSGLASSLVSSVLSLYSSYESIRSQCGPLHMPYFTQNDQRQVLKKVIAIQNLRQSEKDLQHLLKDLCNLCIEPANITAFPGLGALASYFERVQTEGELNNNERYRHEWARFQSFDRYRGNASGIVLARHGFYHDSENGPTATRCFECGATCSNWDYFDKPQDCHHGNCPHKNGNSSRNIPIQEDNEARAVSAPALNIDSMTSTSDSYSNLTPNETRAAVRQETFTGSSSSNQVAPAVTNDQTKEKESFQPTTDRNNTEYIDNYVIPSDDAEETELIPTPADGATGSSSTSSSSSSGGSGSGSHNSPVTTRQPRQHRHGDMAGKSSPPNTAAAAAVGLDLRLPARTQGSQSSLPTPQTLATPTSQQSPPSDQLATPSDPSGTSILATSGQPIESNRTVLGLSDEAVSRLPIETVGQVQTHPELIVVATPKHPDYSNIHSRAATFKPPWPRHLDQTPRRMAEAGLFYSGVADFTRCYACGGGLRNWESGDDPVIEHTRWYPNCPHVKQLKGEKYVRAVTAKQQKHLEERRQQQAQQKQRQPPDPLRTTAASILSEMGYSQNIIRDAIEEVRRNTGRMEVSAEQALLWILDDEARRDDIAVQRAAGPAAFHSQAAKSQPVLVSTASESSSPKPTRPKLTSTPSQSGSSNSSRNKPVTSTSSSSQAGSQQGAQGAADSDDENSVKENGGQPARGKSGKRRKKKKKGGERPASAVSEGATPGPADFDTESLKQENEKLREIQTCKICLDKAVDTTFLPCGHLVCCAGCASKMRKCPICRELIRGCVKTYMS